MRKWPFPFFILLIQLSGAHAQSRIDKNLVMDYFQNMQYEDAIGYLLPAQQTDSLDLQILGYLGYAYHMNDDQAYPGWSFEK